MTDLTHFERPRLFRVLKPEILPARLVSDLFGSKQALSFWLYILALRVLISRVSKTGRPPSGLVEWSVFLLACTAACYATGLSITATIGALRAFGWKPAWVALGFFCALSWVVPAATILLSTAPFFDTSLGVRLLWWGALGGYFAYMVLFVLLWSEAESQRSS
ncbi:MAG: hypothetical protein J0H49_04965 [Acidobacteria bacterium]|nr:hypothetical protein [Acidobacteriota bacterium]